MMTRYLGGNYPVPVVALAAAAVVALTGPGALVADSRAIARERDAAVAQRRLARQAVDELYAATAEILAAAPPSRDR
jgi:hypothetical protein